MKSPSSSMARRDFLRLSGAGLAALGLLSVGCTLPGSLGPSLDVKIGQMILAGFRGYDLKNKNPIQVDLKDRFLGGVVLFDYDVANGEFVRNIESPGQLAALNQELQAATPVPPLLISMDQEGGVIRRLRTAYGFPQSVSQQSLGTLNDLKQTYRQAAATAQTLKSVGVNLNLAPVVDLNVNPDNPIIGKYERSFSADPELVTAHALEVIKAHHESGVLTTLKHFPGHGSSRDDSHQGFVDVTDTWSEIELEPFRNLIRAGMCDVVMTAHIFNSHLDVEYPSTLSKPTITGLLRDELGWDGVVITDDMGMRAITQYYGFEKAIKQAIQAGSDILAFANNGSVFDPTIPARAFDVIMGLVKSGEITEARIDQSYQRIEKLKARL